MNESTIAFGVAALALLIICVRIFRSARAANTRINNDIAFLRSIPADTEKEEEDEDGA